MRFITLVSMTTVIAVIISCGKGEPFPAWDPTDEGATFYYTKAVGEGAEVAAISVGGDPVGKTGWPCDPRAGVVPIADDVLFAYNGALYSGRPGGAPKVLVDFGTGTAEEVQFDDSSGIEVVTSWRIDNSITDIRVDESGRLVAFRLDQVQLPLKKELSSVYSKAQINSFLDRDSFYVDEGAYVLDLENGDATYLLPTADVFCFVGESYLAVEYGLTVCKASLENPDEVDVIVPDGYFELGWTPVVASGGGTEVVLCNRAKAGSDTIVINGLYVFGEGRFPESPAISIESRERAGRVLVSPDGKYAAVDVLTDSLGGSSVYVADIEERNYRLLAEKGSAYTFLPSSKGLVYFVEGGVPGRGDLWAAGLDGSSLRRITDSGDVLPPP
jgi:hypothetical protein